jgi:hypothetical protein
MYCSMRRILLACLVTANTADFATAQLPRGYFTDAQPVPGLEGGRIDHTPWVSADGLRIYFTVGRQPFSDIWYAERNSIDEPFRNPSALPDTINKPGSEECCMYLSPDERSMIFWSDRSEFPETSRTLIAQRDSIDSALGRADAVSA